MINFFRKIRKQLADANKPLKYARYVIGEVVLLVIGICNLVLTTTPTTLPYLNCDIEWPH